MIGGFWGHYVNSWVSTSPTTPLLGLCTSGQILLTDSDVTHSEICPDVQRPGRGVVGLVMTHWLTWYPQIPRFMKCGIEKIKDRCEVRSHSITKILWSLEVKSQNLVKFWELCEVTKQATRSAVKNFLLKLKYLPWRSRHSLCDFSQVDPSC